MNLHKMFIRSSPSEVFLGKGFLKICSKFTGEHPCRSVNSIKLLCNFIEIALRLGCSPAVKLLHIFRTPFYKNVSGGLFLINLKSKMTYKPLRYVWFWLCPLLLFAFQLNKNCLKIIKSANWYALRVTIIDK